MKRHWIEFEQFEQRGRKDVNLKQAPPERYVLEGEEIGLLILIQPQNKTMQNQARAFRDASSSAFCRHCQDISH